MNIFSNVGITELIVILLLALLVVGPERLPELAQQLGKLLRDLRKAYDNLTRELGPELTSIQKSTQELRQSVESFRSIPQDMVQSVIKAAELDETIGELKEAAGGVQQVGQALANVQKTVREPMKAAVDAARGALQPTEPAGSVAEEEGARKESGDTLLDTARSDLESVNLKEPTAAPEQAVEENPEAAGGPAEDRINE
jgi:sec-independent protein translocase protein TatB